jgi:retinol dehydrogenase-14
MGLSSTQEQRREAIAHVQAFVKQFGDAPEALVGGLDGRWRLIFSDAPDITSLGAGPLQEVDFIGQEYDEAKGSCENIIRYRPPDAFGSLLSEDRLEQRVLLSYGKKPSAQYPRRVELKVKGVKVIPERVFGGLVKDLPALGGPGLLAVPFGAFDVLYNDGHMRIVKTSTGQYSVNVKEDAEQLVNGKEYNPPSELVTGKTVLITGGNVGLGLETAKRLARAGARVVLTARTAAKADEALAEVKAVAPDADVLALQLDLADLESVRSFPVAYDDVVGAPLDVLLANAGVMAIPERRTTADGFERQVGVNHLGHFALVSAMLPSLQKAANGFRVVSVSSSAHRLANERSINDALNSNLDPKEYSAWGNYGLSKAANVLFANELQRRFDAAGVRASAVSLHPGVVNTDLFRYFVQDKESAEAGVPLKEMKAAANPFEKIRNTFIEGFSGFLQTPAQGANTHVFLSAAADSDGDMTRDGGKYFEDMRVATPAPYTQKQELSEKLWELSEKLTGTQIDIQAPAPLSKL